MSSFNPPNYYMILNVGMMVQRPALHFYPYHMILAQQYAKGGEEYRSAVKTLSYGANSVPNRQLILDNGAHEGIDIDSESYKEIIEELRPDVVVLPDLVGRPAEESFKVSQRFSHWVMSHYPHMKTMFAGQGQNQDEILEIYGDAFAEWDPARCIIGFGQAYLTWEDPKKGLTQEKARITMIQDIVSYEGAKHLQNHQFHILGGRWGPQSLAWFRDKLNITGLDTVKPLTSCLSKMQYPHYAEGHQKTDLLGTELVTDLELKASVDELVDAYDLAPISW